MYSETSHHENTSWENDVALFIDWENLKYSLHSSGQVPNLSTLIEAAARYGRIVIARAYADWEEPFHLNSRDQLRLYDSGIEPVFVPSRTDTHRQNRRKNSVDVKMSTDCVEVSFTNPHIRTYILVSGDADFLHLANSLRSRGNRVVVIAVSWSTSHRIGDQVDELIFFDQYIPGPSTPSPPTEPLDDLDKAIEDLVALVKEQREQGRYPLLSWLGHQLRRQSVGFNPQSYGFEKFKDLVRYAEEKGVLRVVTQGLVDWALLPEDEIPEVTLEEQTDHMNGDEADTPPKESDYPSPFSHPRIHPILNSDDPLHDYQDVFEDLVQTAEEIESDERYEFMTPGFLGQCLWRKGHWDFNTLPPGTKPASPTLKQLRAGQIRKLVDYAIEAGLLMNSTRFDPTTGKTFTIVHLRHSHPFVQKIATHTPPDTSADANTFGQTEKSKTEIQPLRAGDNEFLRNEEAS